MHGSSPNFGFTETYYLHGHQRVRAYSTVLCVHVVLSGFHRSEPCLSAERRLRRADNIRVNMYFH